MIDSNGASSSVDNLPAAHTVMKKGLPGWTVHPGKPPVSK
jgi:hypothetical protein